MLFLRIFTFYTSRKERALLMRAAALSSTVLLSYTPARVLFLNNFLHFRRYFVAAFGLPLFDKRIKSIQRFFAYYDF